MRIPLRIALGYFLIVGLAGYLVFATFVEEVRPGVKQAMEETMVDAANVLAELAADSTASGTLASGRFAEAVAAYRTRAPRARIFELEKRSTDFRIYVTDARGVVLFDSEGKDTGRDFSRWRDVYRTLRGEYGARATRLDPGDDTSVVMYVAAPVFGRPDATGARPMLGVLTLGKPLQSVQPFATRAEHRVTNAGLLLLGGALLIGAFFTAWLTHSIRRLRDFARAVADGERPPRPALGRNELGDLESAVMAMREKLDGRAYVEQYVQSLTHELKSPIAGLRAAAEVLADPRVTPDEQRQFLRHVEEQTARLTDIVERMLELARVEGLRQLERPESVDVHALLEAETLALTPRAQAIGANFAVGAAAGVAVRGDAFLLRRALANLLENALAFSPAGGAIEVSARRVADAVEIAVEDRGPGVPEFAGQRIFERFYSLPRPGGQRSSGLGLPFVMEIARLHGGRLDAGNREDGGFSARLRLPAA